MDVAHHCERDGSSGTAVNLVYIVEDETGNCYFDEKSQIQALNRTQPVLPWAWATSKA